MIAEPSAMLLQPHDEVPSVDHKEEEDVTEEDLNQMKQMIHDKSREQMIHDMLLCILHQSPVYSKTVFSCQDDSREAMDSTSQAASSISTPKNIIKSTSISYSTSRRRTQNSSTTIAWPISRRTTQSSMSYCQECSDSDSPAEVSKLSVAVM